MVLLTVVISVLMMVLFCLLAIPFVILGAVVGVVLFLVSQILLLPFRLLGMGGWGGAAIIVFFMKAAVVVLLGLFVLVGLVVGLAPLLPLLIILFGLWLIVRSSRSRRATPARF